MPPSPLAPREWIEPFVDDGVEPVALACDVSLHHHRLLPAGHGAQPVEDIGRTRSPPQVSRCRWGSGTRRVTAVWSGMHGRDASELHSGWGSARRRLAYPGPRF